MAVQITKQNLPGFNGDLAAKKRKIRKKKWAPLQAVAGGPSNNATSRGLRRITPGRNWGNASRGVEVFPFVFCDFLLQKYLLFNFLN